MANLTPITIPLSGREMTVLRFVVWGYTNKEIATRLGISVKTVEAHKAKGMQKLQLSGRAALVRQAVEWGWLTPENAPDHDTNVWLQAVPRLGMGVPGTPRYPPKRTEIDG